MPQLDISNFFSQAFWLTLLFGALYSFVKKIMIPGIDKVLSERSREIDSILEEANRNNLEAKKIFEKALSLEKESSFKFSLLEETIFNKIKKENEIKLDKISSDLEKEYENIKSKYEEELKLISKEIPKFSDEIANILLDKIYGIYNQK